MFREFLFREDEIQPHCSSRSFLHCRSPLLQYPGSKILSRYIFHKGFACYSAVFHHPRTLVTRKDSLHTGSYKAADELDEFHIYPSFGTVHNGYTSTFNRRIIVVLYLGRFPGCQDGDLC